MSVLYRPSDKGFDARLEAVDRCQVGLLRELSGQLGGRLILKGGMAMRAAFGSMRLTKDIDFDRDQTISQDTLKRNLEQMLLRAATASGIRGPNAQTTKATKTTVRARLEGQLTDGADVRFEVEVSGRETPRPENVRSVIVVPPAAYSIAPFAVTTYTNETLAAMKIGAALSEQRNAPRDLYDLRDLIRAGTDPVDLLANQDEELLEDFGERALGKLEMLTFHQAQQELLPYLSADERSAMNEDAWMEATLIVASSIERWCSDALAKQQQRRKSGEVRR